MQRNGTTAQELDSILVAPLLFLPLARCLCYFLSLAFIGGSIGLKRLHAVLRFVTEFVTLALPLLFMYTIAADHVAALYVASGSLGVALLLCSLRRKKMPFACLAAGFQEACSRDMGREFLTHYRAYFYLSTIVCILAVDFVVFPVRFLKTEISGKGLMDLGVGCYVMSSGVVSRVGLSEPADVTLRSVARDVASAAKTALMLSAVGLCRYGLMIATKYHTTNVSEYGVHCNFFITLAVVRLCAAILLTTRRWIRAWIWFFVLVSAHQALLKHRLTAYVSQDKARDGAGIIGFVTANREGVVSSVGYVGLYMAGVAFGQMLARGGCLVGGGSRGSDSPSLSNAMSTKSFANGVDLPVTAPQTSTSGSSTTNIQMLMRMVFWSAMSLIGAALCERYVEPVSRRTANAGYVLWMTHVNLSLMAVNFLASIILSKFDGDPVSEVSGVVVSSDSRRLGEDGIPLLAAINSNGLLIFLLANLLTGLINLSTKTRDYRSPAAMAMLTGYLFANCVAAGLLHWRSIKVC